MNENAMKLDIRISEIKKIVNSVNGWLTDDEGKLLYLLAKKCQGAGCIVEIGSWEGKSTIWLGRGSLAGGKNVKVYAIDPHTGSSEHKKQSGDVYTFNCFISNIKKACLEKIVIPLVNTSAEVASDFHSPVELIFIDGEHEYEFVKMDYEMWFPKLIEGGYIAFHDSTTWDGPKKVVTKYVCKSHHIKKISLVNSIAYAQKVRINSVKDRVINRIMLLIIEAINKLRKYKIPYTAKNILKKIVMKV